MAKSPFSTTKRDSNIDKLPKQKRKSPFFTHNAPFRMFNPEGQDNVFVQRTVNDSHQVSGDKLEYFKFKFNPDVYDELYHETQFPQYEDMLTIFGSFSPDVNNEELMKFGIDGTRSATIYLPIDTARKVLDRAPLPGDVVKPFQDPDNIQVFEVREVFTYKPERYKATQFYMFLELFQRDSYLKYPFDNKPKEEELNV